MQYLSGFFYYFFIKFERGENKKKGFRGTWIILGCFINSPKEISIVMCGATSFFLPISRFGTITIDLNNASRYGNSGSKNSISWIRKRFRKYYYVRIHLCHRNLNNICGFANIIFLVVRFCCVVGT